MILLDGLDFRTATPRYVDYGGTLTPPLGGPAQRLNRLGNRFALDVQMPPVPEEPDGRILAAKLRLAKQQGAIFPWPQPGLAIGTPGAPVVDGAVAGGTSLPMRGLTPHYAIRFGQFFSIIHDGARYLHSAAAQATADAAGEAIVTIDPMLRMSLSDGDEIEMAQPMIEGLLESGDLEIPIQMEPYRSIAFSIEEQA